MKLSHSAVNKYSECPQKYKYHYIQKLREPVKSAALYFGSALDTAFNAMLLDKQANSLRPIGVYIDVFLKAWSVGDLNGEMIELKSSLSVAYANSDMDLELVSEVDFNINREQLETEYSRIFTFKKTKGFENLLPKEALFFNEANWLCLKAKGCLMVGTYYNEVLPKIKKVIAVQKKATLDNGAGSAVDCYVDAVLDFGNGAVVTDNKTSSMQYEEDSASTSHQLALYVHALKDEIPTNKTAFIVLYKQIAKNRVKTCTKCGHSPKESRAKTCDKEIKGVRCYGVWQEVINPEARYEIIQGEISEHFENSVVENFDNVLHAVENKVFYKNWSSCVMGYGRCQYYNLCRSGNKKGLIQL